MGRRSSGGGARFGTTASAARIACPNVNNSRVNSSFAMRAANAVAPNLGAAARGESSHEQNLACFLFTHEITAAAGAALRHAAVQIANTVAVS